MKAGLLGALTMLAWLSVDAGTQRQAPAGPPMPYEEAGACPFECCTYRDWTARGPIGVRSDRRTGSPVVFTLKKGDVVRALTGVVVIVKPGRVQFKKPLDLNAMSGTTLSKIHVEPGDTLFLLINRGEGETGAWFKGRVYDSVEGSSFLFSDCAGRQSTCDGVLLEMPTMVWWVRIRTAEGREGWINVPDEFDNKDACS
jgi:hypothetical protein